jgi:preprotein translocase subunit SecF
MKPKKQERTKREHGASAYKTLLIIPMILLLASVAILVSGFMQTGEWFTRSIELKGGTLISVNTPESVNIGELETSLSGFGLVVVRELRSYSGYGISIEVESGVDTEMVLEELRSSGIDTREYSVETIGSSLGESFWIQAQYGVVIAFILMGIIVFIVFRTFVPSIAVMLAAVSDIVITLAIMQLFGISLSLASLAAILMLIGYSIDTDILLTTRLIRVTGSPLRERVFGAFKTGITMTGTTLGVLVALLLTTTSAVLFQIASVLTIGLIMDIINTWLQNATLLRWYCEKRGLL